MGSMFKRLLALILTVSMISGGSVALAVETTAAPTAPAAVEAEKAAEKAQEGKEDKDAAQTDPAPAAQPEEEKAEQFPVPVASGTKVKRNSRAVIDYSNTADGYVMIKFTAATQKRIKAQVKGPTTTYTYNITPGKWEVLPLSDGEGNYQFKVFENISGNKYSSVLSISSQVTLKDEFGPFTRPNQYVDYANAPKTVAKAKELTSGLSKPLDKVAAIYDYVVSTLSYDYDLAASVKSGYLPKLDKVLAKKSGICFDYAALMTGMLRSQDVPCKLVVGYAGSAYHAWINVWSESTGWVNAAIYFDGVAWQRMDPTFASTAKQSEEIMAYIGDGTNYSAKYLY